MKKIQTNGTLYFGESILLYAPNGLTTDFTTETQTYTLSGWYLDSEYQTAADGI